MATVSFTREMKLNKEESERLIEIIESENKNTYKVTTPPAERASAEGLEEIFGRSKK